MAGALVRLFVAIVLVMSWGCGRSVAHGAPPQIPVIAAPPTLGLDVAIVPDADLSDDTRVELRPTPPLRHGITVGTERELERFWRDEVVAPFVAQIGLTRLDNETFEPTYREIRVWGPLGTQRLQWLVRLRITRGHWRGGAYARGVDVCPTDCSDTPVGEPQSLAVEDEAWEALAARLTKLRIWTIAEEPLPYRRFRDGSSILVELRDGPRYRAYFMGNPRQQRGREAKLAASILQELDAVVKAAVASRDPTR